MIDELKQEVSRLKEQLKQAETRLHTEETKQKILSDSKLSIFHELCQSEDFKVYYTQFKSNPEDIVYLDAYGGTSEVSCKGISFRSEELDVTADKRNSSFRYEVKYRIGNGEWKTFYHDSERRGFEIGGFKECKKIWGLEVDLFTLGKFILETLCQLEYVNEDCLGEETDEL